MDRGNKQTEVSGLKALFSEKAVLAVLSVFVAVWWLLSKPMPFDDAYIGMRVAKNFWNGDGLVYNIGSYIKANTSLLYPVLISPAFAFSNDTAFRLVFLFDTLLYTYALATFALVCAHLLAPALKLDRRLVIVALALLIFARQNIMLGMETQLYLAICAAALYLWVVKNRRTAGFVTACLLIFVRPDGILLPAAFLTLTLVENPRKLPLLIGISLVSGGLYLCITWFYYHEIVPHTAAVKNLFFKDKGYELYRFWQLFIYPRVFVNTWLSFAFLAGMGICLYKKAFRILPVFAIYYFLLFTFTATWTESFGWYAVPFQFFYYTIIIIGLFYIFDALSQRAPNMRLLMPFLIGMLLGYTAYMFSYNYMNGQNYYPYYYARYISGRKAGEYLSRLAKPGEYALTEPLGVIGFYAMPAMFKDYPGLTNTDVPKTILHFNDHFFAYGVNYLEMVALLKDVPDLKYLVLRRSEFMILVDHGVLKSNMLIYNYTITPTLMTDANMCVIKL